MIWETVGLWHYSIPGLFLLAQFCLGVFVALCNLVNNSVFLYLTSEEGPSSSDDHLIDGMSYHITMRRHFNFIYSLLPQLTVKQYDALFLNNLPLFLDNLLYIQPCWICLLYLFNSDK